jgi:uncharacterized protein
MTMIVGTGEVSVPVAEEGLVWPGSEGEHIVQARLGTTERAQRFYRAQMLDHLNARMKEFVSRQEMFFLATADRRGECDTSFRAGPPGVLFVAGERTVLYPEYRGNGVLASLGNIEENPHVGILLIDFEQARVGLHINGRAEVLEDVRARAEWPDLPVEQNRGQRAQVWVKVSVEEAYIHCTKRIPQMRKVTREEARAATENHQHRGADYFGAAASRS